MNKRLHLILLVLAALLIASLSIANMQAIPINFLIGTVKVPLIILILLCVILGFLLEILVSLPKSMTKNRQIKELLDSLEEQKKIIADLKK